MQPSEMPLLDSFIKSLHHLSEHTRKSYQRDVTCLENFCDKQEINKWSDIDCKQIRRFVASRHKEGISGRSLQRNLSAIRSFYYYLLELDKVKKNPAEGVVTPKTSRKLPNVLDTDQTVQLVEIKQQDDLAIRDRAMLELIYSSGLRLAELVSTNINDVDFSDRLLTVIGKGKKMRNVPIGKHAIKAINNWLKIRQYMINKNEIALFVSQQGKRISPRSVQYRLKKWAVKQGLPSHVHPHMLRHSFASHMLESSGDLRAVQELLGHADISTTQVYTHLDFQHLSQIYDKSHPRAYRKKSDR
ncbi:MAG: tyrosine recombinase XerC [Legionellales bacterium]|nr:tyrosine recombinase XerC [Legionellales bacterium]